MKYWIWWAGVLLAAEESAVSQLEVENRVMLQVVVWFTLKSDGAPMSTGITVYLYVSLEEIQKRIRNIKTRGIVIIQEVRILRYFKEGTAIYDSLWYYADCTNKSVEQPVTEAVLLINELDR